MRNWQRRFINFLGPGPDNISSAEKLASVFGGFFSIVLVGYVTYQVTGATGSVMIVPAMGATAVLLFAVPHGRLSQPWPLFAGNTISALIGVSCYILVPNEALAAGLAVGLALGAMHVFRCLHPPGGATAIVAVIGGDAITSLGYSFVVIPVLLNVVIIFLVALIFNNMFVWRRYPASMMKFTDSAGLQSAQTLQTIDKSQIEKALEEMDLVVDVTSDDLQRLLALTLEHAANEQLSASQVKLGHYYTNGLHGAQWSVRRIIDEHCSDDPLRDMVIYRVVEGHGLRSSDSCTRRDFANWASREVFPVSEPDRLE